MAYVWSHVCTLKINTHSSMTSHFPYIAVLQQSKSVSYLSLTSLYWFTCREKSIKTNIFCLHLLLHIVKKFWYESTRLLIGSSCLRSTKPDKRADTSRCFPVVLVVPKQCCHGNSKSKGQLLAPNSDIPLLSFPKMPLTRCGLVWVPQNTLQWHTLSKWLPNPAFTPPPTAAFTSGSHICCCCFVFVCFFTEYLNTIFLDDQVFFF